MTGPLGPSVSPGLGGDSQARLTALAPLCPLPVSLLRAFVVLRTHCGPGAQSHRPFRADRPCDREVPAARERAGAPA